ncbi:MAG: phage portal protein [Firmicutes bacterium]|nr:phage portal protein [Bacillota bacterium]
MPKAAEKQSAVKAYVLSDGKVIRADVLEQYAVKGSPSESKQLAADRFTGLYGELGLVAPPHNLETLVDLLEANTYHMRAVKTKARDTAGLGWTLRPRLDDAPETEIAALKSFLDEPHPELALVEILDHVMVDYEACGNGDLEVLRVFADGPATGLAHLPAHTMRVHRDRMRYCQIVENQRRWFKRFGVPYDVDMYTGAFAALGSIPFERRASEVIHFLNYTSKSAYYGVPDVLPALGVLLGDAYRRDYTLKFFENHAIPAYAVVVEGADLDEETERTIQDFFEHKVKGNPHSTLVLTAQTSQGQTVNIKFEKLDVEMRDVSFRLYRQDNRDEILAAHGVPPYRMGISETGNLGGSNVKGTTEIYKNSVIRPRQETLETRFNRHVVWGCFGARSWEWKLNEIDTADEEHDLKMSEGYCRIAVFSPNDVRERLGKQRVADPAMDAYYLNGQPITGQSPAALLDAIKGLHRDLVAAVKAS